MGPHTPQNLSVNYQDICLKKKIMNISKKGKQDIEKKLHLVGQEGQKGGGRLPPGGHMWKGQRNGPYHEEAHTGNTKPYNIWL